MHSGTAIWKRLNHTGSAKLRGPFAHRSQPKTVVEVAAQTASLLFPRGNKPLAGALQIGREVNRMSDDTGLTGQNVEQPLVGGIEGLAGGARGEEQPANSFLLVDEWQRQRLPYRRAGGSRDCILIALFQRDRRVR